MLYRDYKLRAANHREKKSKLKQLKQKVLEKNPDEFSFVRHPQGNLRLMSMTNYCSVENDVFHSRLQRTKSTRPGE